MVSETSIQINSQRHQHDVSLDSAGNSIVAQGLSQARQYAKKKPRFVEFSCSHIEVSAISSIFKKAMHRNSFRYSVTCCWSRKLLFQSNSGETKRISVLFSVVGAFICLSCGSAPYKASDIKEFIGGRRHETVTLHHVLQGFSTTECDWLIPPGPGMKRQERASITDSLKRRELLEEFIFWYFDSFVLPLIKVCYFLFHRDMTSIYPCRLPSTLQTRQHSGIKYCISVKTIGKFFARLW